MSNIEQEVKRKIRRLQIQKIILATLFTLGSLSVAALAPQMLKILGSPAFLKNKYRKYSFNRSLARLKEASLIFFEKTEKGNFVRLTPKGEEKLRKFQLNDFKIKKPKRWDGKWRLLIFDIKEERKSVRDKIRRNLFKMGLLRLQDSVWVYPYDCEDYINLMKADFKIGKDLLYVVADKIENDQPLLKHFKI